MWQIMKKIKLAFDPYLVLTFLLITTKVYVLIDVNNLNIFKGVFLINAGLILLFLVPAYCLAAKPRSIYLYLSNFIVTILLVADLLYFRYFGTLISINMLFQVANLSGLGSGILNLWKGMDSIYFIDLLILPFIFFRKSGNASKNFWSFLRDFVIGIVIIAFMINMNYLDGRIFTRYKSTDILYFWGPLGYHVMDTAYFIKDRNIKLTPDVEAKVMNWYAEKNPENEDASIYRGLGKDKNLIVIQLESFQNFLIGLKIGNQEITPNLNKLVKNSLYFPHFYPQTVQGNSSDAELITNTSLYPIKEGSTFFKYYQNKYYSLPLLLKSKGYKAVAIHGDEAGYWNRDKAYPSLGFEYYYSEENMDKDEVIELGLSDEATFRQSVAILKKLPQPFYSLIVTLTSHYPYWMPGDKVSLSLPAPISQAHLGNYLRTINYTDKALGQFIQQLEEQGMLENTVIAIYGDHAGLRQGDRPQIENLLLNKTITEEEWIRSYLPVPFLIYNSEQQGQTIDVYGGQVDFLPTIAYYMGLNPNVYKYAMGANLLTIKQGRVIIPRGDYIPQTIGVSKDKVETNINRTDLETLDVSDIIIRTNFFDHMQQKR